MTKKIRQFLSKYDSYPQTIYDPGGIICSQGAKCFNTPNLYTTDIVNEYNNTYHRTIKRNPVDVKSKTFIDFNVENNYKDPNFENGDHV